MKTLLIVILTLTSLTCFGLGQQTDQRVIIAKCEFSGNASNKIEVGSPFLYIFGKRIVNGTTAQIEDFEVEHEIAALPDDITSDFLPNLDPKKVFKADFPPVDPNNPRDAIRSVHWKHEPIDGKTDSTILQVIIYRDDDQFHTQSRGTYSALAHRFNFTGQYPYCWVHGMPR